MATIPRYDNSEEVEIRKECSLAFRHWLLPQEALASCARKMLTIPIMPTTEYATILLNFAACKPKEDVRSGTRCQPPQVCSCGPGTPLCFMPTSTFRPSVTLHSKPGMGAWSATVAAFTASASMTPVPALPHMNISIASGVHSLNARMLSRSILQGSVRPLFRPYLLCSNGVTRLTQTTVKRWPGWQTALQSSNLGRSQLLNGERA